MKATTWLTAAMAAVIAAGILLACTPTGQALSDEQISLRKEDMLATTDAPPLNYAGKDPGENRILERSFFGAPPMIPHVVEVHGVSAEVNDCLDCHEKGDKDTPGLSTSHRIKPRFKVWERAQAREGMVTTLVGYDKADVVSGTRYDCLLCHAPQAADTPALVGNTFESKTPGDATPDVLDQLNSVGKF